MLQRAALARHVSGIAVSLTMMFACSAIAPIATAAAVATYMAGFMLAHELAHGALGLSRRHNEVALAIAGVCIVTSGHALRLMHLRHHADPLGAGDLEGRPAQMTAGRALVTAPWLAVLLVIAAWRAAPRCDRAWQCAEYAAIAGVVVLGALGPRLVLGYLVSAIALQALAPFWAGHLPHRSPRWLLALAEALARRGSMIMATLAIHEDHHRWPKHPVIQLRSASGLTRAAPTVAVVVAGSMDGAHRAAPGRTAVR